MPYVITFRKHGVRKVSKITFKTKKAAKKILQNKRQIRSSGIKNVRIKKI